MIRLQAEESGGRRDAAAILDAPLLWEAGWNGWCDKIIFVDVPGKSGYGGHWPAAGAARSLPPVRAAQESLEETRRCRCDDRQLRPAGTDTDRSPAALGVALPLIPADFRSHPHCSTSHDRLETGQSGNEDKTEKEGLP